MPRRSASIRKSLAQQTDLQHHAEHCSVDPQSLVAIGRDVHQQVRIERDGDERGIYTVFESIPDAAGVVRMGPDGRLRLGKAGPFAGHIDSQVPNPTLCDGDAETGNEFVERLFDDDPTQTGFIALAPHGGDIELHTDEQALAVATALSATCWLCKGWHHRGAKRHWHITAAEINEASFPLLDTVMTRGFTHAVAFHGMDEQEILIGGAAPDVLKHEVMGAILVATSGSGIKVRVAEPSDVNGGDDVNNIVNRITAGGANGVQIEQSARAREDFGAAIAAAVVDVYRPRL
ncbi:MAG TPA: poly-gamma-glutamate hydrolase family protein [Acidimicrobiales bacterium]|jgi:phage replication-related protein YjqB (UPF0714/DUF867 family)